MTKKIISSNTPRKNFDLKKPVLIGLSYTFVVAVVLGTLASTSSSSSILGYALVSSGASSTSSAANTCTTFSATKDTYVTQVGADGIYGTLQQMNIGSPANSARSAYLTFNPSGIVGAVTSAKIVLTESPATGAAGYPMTAVVYPSPDWGLESTLSWNTQPALNSTMLGNYSGPSVEAQPFDINLTNTSTIMNEVVNFRITNGSLYDVDIAAREQGPSTAPKLVVCSTNVASSATTSTSMSNMSGMSMSNSSMSSTNMSTASSMSMSSNSMSSMSSSIPTLLTKVENGKNILDIQTSSDSSPQGSNTGNTLNFSGIKVGNGQFLANYPVNISVTTPSNVTVILSTTSDSAGNVSVFLPKTVQTANIFNIFGSINAEAAGSNYTFVQGNASNLTAPGNYSAFMTLNYGGVAYNSPTISFGNTGNNLMNTIRSGGVAISIIMGIGITSMLGYFGYSTLKGKNNE